MKPFAMLILIRSPSVLALGSSRIFECPEECEMKMEHSIMGQYGM